MLVVAVALFPQASLTAGVVLSKGKSRGISSPNNTLAVPVISSPNGGETLLAGDTAAVVWSGSAPQDTITLEYTTNGGQQWLPVTSEGVNLSHKWRIPKTPGTNCLARSIRNPLAQDNWAQSAGRGDNDVANSVATDNNGNVYVVGYFASDSISFGPVALKNSTAFTSDVYVVKYSPNGNPIWAWRAGGADNDAANGVAVDRNGDILIAGYFTSASITFGSITLYRDAAVYADVFTAKLRPDGSVVWANRAGGAGSDFAQSVAVDGAGNSVIVGFSNSPTVDFSGTMIPGAGGQDMFIAKYDAGGALLWAKGYGGAGNDFANSVAVDRNDNPILVGYFSSASVQFGSATLNTSGGSDMCVVKFDAAGTPQWARKAGGNANEFAYSVAADVAGNIAIAGKFTSGSVAFGSTTLFNSSPLSDFFIAKYAPDGSILWANSAGGGDNEGASMNSIAFDDMGNVVAAGFFSSDKAAFGKDTLRNATAPFSDIFVATYSPDGSLFNLIQKGGSDGDNVAGAAIDSRGFIVLVGSFLSSNLIIGRDTLKSRGLNDVLVWKLNPRPPEGDTSDAFFIIAVATASGENIDMKGTGVGTDKDSSVVGGLRNTGAYPVKVESILISGVDSAAFSVQSALPPYQIAVGGAATTLLRFSPKRAGLHTANITFVTRTDTIRQTITGLGLTGGAQILASALSFRPAVCQPSVIDTVRIQNSGTLDLSLSDGVITGADQSDFALVEPFAQTSITPGETVLFPIRFTPGSAGVKNATFRVTSNSTTNSVLDISLSGSRESAAFSTDMTVVSIGTVCIGEFKDTSFTLTNSGSLANRMTVSLASQPDDIIRLQPGSSSRVFVRFSARQSEGVFSDSVTITDSICAVVRTVILTATVSSPKLAAADANCYAVPGASGQSEIRIRNTGARAVTIASLPSLPSLFSFGAVTLPIIIAPGDSALIPVIYSPTDTSEQVHTVSFFGMPCNISISAGLRGHAAGSRMAADDAEGEVGDMLNVTVRLTQPQFLAQSGVTSVTSQLKFNATMLVPINTTPVGQIIGNERVIPLDFAILPSSQDLSKTFQFRVVLGNDTVSALTIDPPQTTGGTTLIAPLNGTFRLKGICYAGGPRLMNTLGKVAVAAIRPNPVGNSAAEIDIETIERAVTTVLLYDASGAIVKRIFSGLLTPGKNVLQCDVSGLVAGSYLIVLETPTIRQSAVFEIQK